MQHPVITLRSAKIEVEVLATSLTQARRLGYSHYFTGDPCKYGHRAPRFSINARCMKCHSLAVSADHQKNKERKSEIRKQSYQKHQEKRRAESREFRQNNLEVSRQRRKAWGLENPEKQAVNSRNRRARNRNAVGNHSAHDIADILKMQKHRCAYCKEKLTKTNQNIDHIVPLSKGGSNHRRNLQALCQPCNSRKHARDPIVHARSLGRLI